MTNAIKLDPNSAARNYCIAHGWPPQYANDLAQILENWRQKIVAECKRKLDWNWPDNGRPHVQISESAGRQQ